MYLSLYSHHQNGSGCSKCTRTQLYLRSLSGLLVAVAVNQQRKPAARRPCRVSSGRSSGFNLACPPRVAVVTENISLIHVWTVNLIICPLIPSSFRPAHWHSIMRQALVSVVGWGGGGVGGGGGGGAGGGSLAVVAYASLKLDELLFDKCHNVAPFQTVSK